MPLLRVKSAPGLELAIPAAEHGAKEAHSHVKVLGQADEREVAPQPRDRDRSLSAGEELLGAEPLVGLVLEQLPQLHTPSGAGRLRGQVRGAGVPSSPSLIGQSLHGQAVAISPTFNALGAVTSNGVTGVIGDV